MTQRSASRRPRRRWLLLVIPLALLLALAGGLRLLLQPERMGALIVEQAEAATGLMFELATPARLGLWPNLHLELVGLDVRTAPGEPALLRAERVDLSLPIAVLWAERPEIGRIELLAPDLDLDAVARWLRADVAAGPPKAMTLPEFATTAQASGGRLRLGELLLEDVEARLGGIRDGEPLRLDMQASLVGAAGSTPLTLGLVSTPRQHREGVTLGAFELRLGQPGAAGHALELIGEVDLFLPQRLRLDLQLSLPQPWLLPLPRLPAEAEALLAGPLALSYDGPGDFSGRLRAGRREGEAEFLIAAVPRSLLAWIIDPAGSPLPPAAIRIALPNVDVEGVRIEGLRIEQEPDQAASDAPPTP